MTDPRNVAVPTGLTPIAVALLVILIGTGFGFNSGYAFNSARVFGPRLFTEVAGSGLEVFRANNRWWWVPIAGPRISVVGGWLYDACVGNRFPESARP